MRDIMILRHAKSSWKHAGKTDHERPLNKRGERDAPRMGRWIRERGLVPDRILCSDAARARQTLELASSAGDWPSAIDYFPQLYLAAPSAYVELIANLPNDIQKAMVIGHNPGLEELVLALTGDSIFLSTACFVHVRMPIEGWAELSLRTQGELLEVQRPKELPAEV